jgi:hypothetical protein
LGLLGSTSRRLAECPAVLFTAEPGDALARLLQRYSPAVRPLRDRLVFGNGVQLYGPVDVTPDLERKAHLPPGSAVAYYARISAGSKNSRPDHLKWQDAERLIRGLAIRLGATVHDQRPPMDLKLEVSVFSAQPPPPVEQVIDVLQPYVDSGKLIVDDDTPAKDAYFLVTEESPTFFVVYWPQRLSRVARLPPAVGVLRAKELCGWHLTTTSAVAAASRELCLKVGGAALALAGRTGGIVVDTYGFPIDRAEDLLPR